MTDLQTLAQVLDDAGFESLVFPLKLDVVDVPIEQMLVHLITDDQGRTTVAQLLFLSALQKAAGELLNVGEDESAIDLLQIYATLPFEIKPDTRPALAMLLLNLNRYLPISGFGVDDGAGVVFCRHTLFCPGGEVDTRVLLEVLDLMVLFIRKHTEILEQVATGAKSLEDALAELEQRTENDD